jgi:hypothetical protein
MHVIECRYKLVTMKPEERIHNLKAKQKQQPKTTINSRPHWSYTDETSFLKYIGIKTTYLCMSAIALQACQVVSDIQTSKYQFENIK